MKITSINKIAIAASSIVFASAAMATISIELEPSVTPNGDGSYDWSYSTIFVNGYSQTNESHIAIFDFAGYIPSFEITPAGWTFSTSATGPSLLASAANLAVPSHSDSDLVNLIWTFTGLSGVVPNFTTLEFGARSMYSNMVQNSYGSNDRAYNGSADSNSASQGPTNVPGAANVPDGGSTVAFAGLGLLALGVMSRRLRTNIVE